jgi:hypothetical protein
MCYKFRITNLYLLITLKNMFKYNPYVLSSNPILETI